MCEITTNFKLCTCVGEGELPDNHWVFYRYDSSRNEMIMGETTLPRFFDETKIETVNQMILDRLNSGEAFDKVFTFHKKDRLRVTVVIKDKMNEAEPYDFGFEYSRKKWKESEFDWLTWHWHHEEAEAGKIK
jgi:hypothetical protein